jgi:hypothetical protein
MNRVQEGGVLAEKETPAQIADRLSRRPPEETSWFNLHQLSNHDPELAVQRWEEMKLAALDELQAGHRAAVALENGHSTAWKRAQFLALRHELMQEWEPRNGIERQLIDTMAEARTVVLLWSSWLTPGMLGDEAIEQAAAMVDRFNRIFLRTLRALRDLRRLPPAVVVANADQVNVGGQQVNMVGGRKRGRRDD